MTTPEAAPLASLAPGPGGATEDAGPRPEPRGWPAAGAAALGALLGAGLPSLRVESPLQAAILDALPDGIMVLDRDGAVVFENRVLRERMSPAIARSDYFCGDARIDAGLECPAASSLLDGLPHEVVREVIEPGGEHAYLEFRSTPLFDRESRLAGVLTVVRDDTARVLLERERARDATETGEPAPRRIGSWLVFERERARHQARLEQAVAARTADLERAKETLRNILDGIPDPIAVVHDSSELVFKNAAAKALPEEVGLALRRAFEERLCQTTLHAGRPAMRLVEVEGARREARVFETFAYPVPAIKPGARLAIFFARDITERRALERQAIRNERLAVVGELAAGLAHEIRTPLTSISNSVRLLEGAVPADAGDDARLVLRIIAKEAKRLSALLADFLTFARPRPPRPVPTDLNALVREAVGIARHSRPHAEAVVVELALADGLPEAPVDRDQLQQALLNIVTNALEACLAGGQGVGAATLTVSTAGPAQGRGGWEIAVSDTGPGIAPEDRARLFEPFFSKKPDGTGLGLAITKRIVDAHGGRIEVMSRPAAGATFVVVLPVASGAGALQEG